MNCSTEIIWLGKLLDKAKWDFIRLAPHRQSNWWSLLDQSLFVESILLGFPTSPFFFSYPPRGSARETDWFVIDGGERIKALIAFEDNLFELRGLTYFPEYNGLNYRDIPQYLKKRFVETHVTCCFMDYLSEVEKYKIRDMLHMSGSLGVDMSKDLIKEM